VDQDAPGVRPAGPGQALGAGTGRGGLRAGIGRRGGQRGA
jgi:hypothetical protein